MSRFGWAYVNSIVTGAAVIGPDRGVVLNEGGYASASTNFSFSGSTGSINGQLNITGNVIVSGTLFAEQYSSTVISSSIIYTSGSTKFGDDAGDTHQFTGSLLNTVLVSSSLGRFTTLTGSTITSSLATINTLTSSAITASSITGATFDINGGTIDDTKIGETTQQSGKFTTLSSSNNLDVGGQITTRGNLIVSGGATLGDNNTDVILVNGQITGSFFAITGGTINNTSIGATQQQSGRFTSLSASSGLTVVGNSNLGGNLIVSGNTTLGDASSDIVTSTAQVTASNGLRLTGGKRIELTDPAGTNVKAYMDGNIGDISGSGNLVISGTSILNGQVTFNGGATGSAFDINGGTIDNTAIGNSVQQSGKFTTLSASNNLDVVGNVTVTGVTTLNSASYFEAAQFVQTRMVSSSTTARSLTTNDYCLFLSGSTAFTCSFPTTDTDGRTAIIRNMTGASVLLSASSAVFRAGASGTGAVSTVLVDGTTYSSITFIYYNGNWWRISSY